MVQSRVVQALNILDSMQDLKNTNDQVERAIAERNYEVAARHIYRVVYTQVALPHDICYEMILASQLRLRALITADVQEAEAHDDHTKLLKCARLYPLLGLHHTGLVLYSQVMRRMLTAALDKQSNYYHYLDHYQ